MTSVDNAPDTYRKDPRTSLGVGKLHSMANDIKTGKIIDKVFEGHSYSNFFYCCDLYLRNTFKLTLTDFDTCTLNDVNKGSRDP